MIGAISEAENLTGVAHRTIAIEDVEIFYREAGNADCPTLLLLHGFPTSSAARLQAPSGGQLASPLLRPQKCGRFFRDKTMSHQFAEIMFADSVKAAQEQNGSRARLGRFAEPES